MGFYSWTCAKTNLPILADGGWHGHPFTQAVLLTREGVVVKGTYTGYGQIDDLHFADSGYYDRIEDGSAKLVIASKYAPGDDFDSLGRSRNDPGQGFFHDQDFIDALSAGDGFSTYAGYCAAYKRELPLEFAMKADAVQMKLFMKTLHRLRVSFSHARIDELGLRGSVEPSHFEPRGLALAPRSGGMDAFALEFTPEDGPRSRLPLTLAADASDADVEVVARQAIEICDVRKDRDVVFRSGGEDVATIECWSSAAQERWHFLVQGEERRFFWNPYEALDEVPPEYGGRDALVAAGARDALYPDVAPTSPRIVLELPAPEPSSPAL